MAILLGCDSVSLEFPTKHIFDSVTLGVGEGDRIGIVGKNGGGAGVSAGPPCQVGYWSVGLATPDSSDQSSTPLFLR